MYYVHAGSVPKDISSMVDWLIKKVQNETWDIHQRYFCWKRQRHTGLDPVVQKVANAIQWKNPYPLDNSIGFACVYPVDSDLSGG